MCPEAHARIAMPNTAMGRPIKIVVVVGCEKTIKITANKKPNGTRQRCIHVPALANLQNLLKKLPMANCRFVVLFLIISFLYLNKSFAFQSFLNCIKDSLDFNIHTNPFRARTAMTVFSAINVVTFNTYIV